MTVSVASHHKMIPLSISLDFCTVEVLSCECEDIFQVLVSNGLFPTAPVFPRMAVAIHLLDFYQALFERSCDAVNAMASALNTYYTRRGYIILNKKVSNANVTCHDTYTYMHW